MHKKMIWEKSYVWMIWSGDTVTLTPFGEFIEPNQTNNLPRVHDAIFDQFNESDYDT